jgi:hypothetical protein
MVFVIILVFYGGFVASFVVWRLKAIGVREVGELSNVFLLLLVFLVLALPILAFIIYILLACNSVRF